MTPCTICAAPCPGTDDDDDVWCAWCFDAYVAWSAARPLGLWRGPWQRDRRGPEEAAGVTRAVDHA